MRRTVVAYEINKGNLSPDKTKACTTHPDLYTLWKITGIEKDPILVNDCNNIYETHKDLVYIPIKQNLSFNDVDKLYKKRSFRGKEII